MAFPSISRTLLVAFLAVAPVFAAPAAAPRPARPGDPYLSIPLETLGFDPIPARFLVGGATMFTLHFVDRSHLLLTYNSRGLIPRLPDATPEDEDRLITALLLELPAGKVVARTQWHTRDQRQYLWPLSHGLFLLRIRSRFTLLDPGRRLQAADPFQQTPFLQMDRRIALASVSPSADLLVIETLPPPEPSGATPATSLPGTQAGPAKDPVAQIHFFRLLFQEKPGETPHLLAQSAGTLASHSLFRVPATADGFLDITRESPQTWLFDFQSHAGKRLELAPFDSSCAPSPYFISRSEFVAFGCHGSDSKLSFSGFNFRGEQPWIQILPGQQIAPFIIAAPDAGRFAFSRITMSNNFYSLDTLSPEDLTAQEIMVLQHHDGRTLLKVQASPIQRTGQNFDLSSDGLSFTVLRAGNLEVYHLPPLTPTDREQLKLAASAFPEKNEARIRLNPLRPASTPKGGTAQPVEAVDAAAADEPPPSLKEAPAKDKPEDLAPLTNPVDIVNALRLPGDAQPSVPKPAPPPPPAAPPADTPEPPRPPPSLYGPPKPPTP